MESVYVSRDNAVRRELMVSGRVLTADEKTAIQRVSVHIGGLYADTDEDPTLIEYSGGVVTIYPGRMELGVGGHLTHISVFDAGSPLGLAWDSFITVVQDWPESQ